MTSRTLARTGKWAVFLAALVVGSPPAMALVTHNNIATAVQLQTALTASQNNNDDDLILLTAAHFNIANNGGLPFTYAAANTEAHSLTIRGMGNGQTVIEGALNGQLMNLDTTAVVGDIDTSAAVRGITFFHGHVLGEGGGLAITTDDADIAVIDCVFDRNQAEDTTPADDDGAGGAASLRANGTGDIQVALSVFDANESDTDGGGLAAFSFSGDVRVARSLFHGNTSALGGGLVLASFAGVPTMANDIFSENHATSFGGAGAVSSLSDIRVLNNDFFDNEGFGILYAIARGEADFHNNLFFQNVPGGSDVEFDDTGGMDVVLSVFNNMIDGFCRFSTSSCDLADLGDSQGNNLTGADPLFADAAAHDFHLLPGSPAINAGDSDAPGFDQIEFDIEGNARIDGTAPDIGAYETVGACGDGAVEAGEECDDGAENSDTAPDACRTACLNTACGDGVVDSGEICDDGNTDDGDACPSACAEETPPEGTGGTGTTGMGTAGTGTAGTSDGGGGNGGGCSLIR